MSLSIYNTLSRKKEPFEPVTPGKIGIYLCGPTVYKPSHVGHAVGPIIFDAIKRYLVYLGYEVTWVVNITDVDDKLIIEAANQNTSTFELAERITKDYLDAMALLHVDGIDLMPKASEHMQDIVSIIERLAKKDIAYESDGDVYFDVSKDEGYGKLSNRRIEDQEGQRDLKSGDKRNPGDFALWKAAKPDEPDEVKFDSPWGQGRPGWHIECSAMAMRYLGDTFDIHGGGLDLVFPHHENEIAQSECCTGKPFANYWMHNGLTRFNTKKIAKSDADPEMQKALIRMTLHNLLVEHSPELIRFLILSTQYRSPIEYSDAELASKRKGIDTFYRLFERVERLCGSSPYGAAGQIGNPPLNDKKWAGPALESDDLRKACDDQLDAFTQAMNEDFNTGVAIAGLFELAGTINRTIEQGKLESAGSEEDKQCVLTAAGRLICISRLLGLFLDPIEKKSAGDDGVADKAMDVLIKIRQHLRKEKKDFETADMIRDLLADSKITLEDRADGTLWRAE